MPQVNPIIKRGLQDKMTRLMLDGKADVDIAKELGVTRKAVYAYKKKVRKGTEKVQTTQNGMLQTEVLKGTIRLEISQENALSDLSKQMEQYTENYERSMRNGDEKGAYAWSARRVDLLEKMLKVTGLYDAPTAKQEPIVIRFMEVNSDGIRADGVRSRRARDILTVPNGQS